MLRLQLKIKMQSNHDYLMIAFHYCSGKRFGHCFYHISIYVLQIYVFAEEDKIKTIEKISFQ